MTFFKVFLTFILTTNILAAERQEFKIPEKEKLEATPLYNSICPNPNVNGSASESGLIGLIPKMVFKKGRLSSCGINEVVGDIKGNLISGITIVDRYDTDIDTVQSDCNEIICRAKNADLIIQRAEKVIDLSENYRKKVSRNLNNEVKKWKDFLSDPIESYSFEETEKYLSISIEDLIINQFNQLPEKAKAEYETYFENKLRTLQEKWKEDLRKFEIEEERRLAKQQRLAEEERLAYERRLAEERQELYYFRFSILSPFFLLFIGFSVRDLIRRRKFKILKGKMGKYIRKLNPSEIFCIHCHGKELLYSDNYISSDTKTWYVRKDGTRALIATAQTKSSTAYTLDRIFWKCNSCSSLMATVHADQLPRRIGSEGVISSPRSYKPRQIKVSNNSPIKFKVFKSKSDRDYYNYDSASGYVLESGNKLGERGLFWYLFFMIFTWFYIDIALVVF